MADSTEANRAVTVDAKVTFSDEVEDANGTIEVITPRDRKTSELSTDKIALSIENNGERATTVIDRNELIAAIECVDMA